MIKTVFSAVIAGIALADFVSAAELRDLSGSWKLALDRGDVEAHSVSDNTQGNWNGIVGVIKLVRKDPVFTSNVEIFSDVESKTARLEIEVKNTTGTVQTGILNISAETVHAPAAHKANALRAAFESRSETQTVVADYPMGDAVRLWDEFNPSVYRLTVQLDLDAGGDAWAPNRGVGEPVNTSRVLQPRASARINSLRSRNSI